MSALAHMIESRGIPTTTIGLVRPHLEHTRPPRSLWVPFPLGRPFGEPEDAAFQHRVLGDVLALLEREDGPVLLEDFPDDAPGMTDTPEWQPAVTLPAMPTDRPATPDTWVEAFATELRTIQPVWETTKEQSSRTTVGNSRLDPSEWAPYAANFLKGEIPDSPIDGISAAVLMRYIADDIKALYYEAVQSERPRPSMRQIEDWFWNKTLAADFLRALRNQALDSSHNGFHTACSRFVVPMPYVERAA